MVRPAWGSVNIRAVRTTAVEQWLRQLTRANSNAARHYRHDGYKFHFPEIERYTADIDLTVALDSTTLQNLK